MTRHLNEGCLGGRHNAERITDRAPVPRNHAEEKVGGAGLIALEDRVGQQVEGFVLTNLIAV